MRCHSFVFGTAAVSLLALINVEAVAVDLSCPKDQYQTIDLAQKSCFKRRAVDPRFAFVLNQGESFGTHCPVALTLYPLNDHPTVCKSVENSLRPGDVLRIDEWAPDELELSIRNRVDAA